MRSHTLAGAPRSKRALPDDSRIDALRAWLEQHFGARAFTLELASQDASFRRYFRVRAGTDSFVAMDAPPDREDCSVFSSVSALLRGAELNAPEVHAAQAEQGFLLLDDLGTRSYLDVLSRHTAGQLYGDALDALLIMQRRVPASAVPVYDAALLRSEMQLFPEWFLERHLGVRVEDGLREALEETFDALAAACTEQPVVFVHRDFHARNLMHCPGHNPGILDFQDAVAGAVTYDLVSLLRDVYVRWPRARVEAWVRGFHDRAVACGHLESAGPRDFQRWFDLTGVQRHLKIAGIFARLCHRDGKPGYLHDIPLTLEYLLQVGARHAESARLCALLEERAIKRRLAERNAAASAK